MDERVVITLIRHGVTAANQAKQYLGWDDEPLSQAGKDQLELLTQLDMDPDLIMTSDLTRCIQTAAQLFPEKNYDINANLREFHFGDWERKTYEQLKHSPAYRLWLDDNSQPVPNGETKQIFEERLKRGLLEIAERIEQQKVFHCAVVTHGGVIRTYLEWLAPIERSFWQWRAPHGGIWVMETTTERLRRRERCISLREVLARENVNG